MFQIEGFLSFLFFKFQANGNTDTYNANRNEDISAFENMNMNSSLIQDYEGLENQISKDRKVLNSLINTLIVQE